MNPFVEHLPWRLAAIAGLIIGAVSLWAGYGLWACLLRIGAAFALFGLGGLALRAIMTQQSRTGEGGRSAKPPGTYVDRVTPPLNVEDVSRPANSVNGRGDEND